MNPNNYCTLEASQRLVAAGIELETNQYWWPYENGTYVLGCNNRSKLPAPSMAELWRELPNETVIEKIGIKAMAYVSYIEGHEMNENPCDALADLLIWVRGRKEDGR